MTIEYTHIWQSIVVAEPPWLLHSRSYETQTQKQAAQSDRYFNIAFVHQTVNYY